MKTCAAEGSRSWPAGSHPGVRVALTADIGSKIAIVWAVVAILSLSPAQAADSIKYIGLHPHAREQPTTQGRLINVIDGFEGKIYFGYGDTVNDTGPIVLSSYEPRSGAWEDRLTFRTERVGRFRELSGLLWAPAFDPQGRMDIGYASGNNSQPWSEHSLDGPVLRVGPVHTYDATGRGMTPERYLAGAYKASGGGGVIRYTPVVGWTVSLSVRGPTTRFYNIAELNGKVYTVLGGVIGTDPVYDVGDDSYVFDGVSWSRGPKLDGFIKPMKFADKLVFRSQDGRLLAFDGTVVTELGIPDAVDHDVDTGKLVVLSGHSHRLYSTTDLLIWKNDGQVPESATAVGLVDGAAYIATSGSQVYSLKLH
jgi:hypothetical protein